METQKPGQGRFLRVVIKGVSLDEAKQLPLKPVLIHPLEPDLIRLTFAADKGAIDTLLLGVLAALPPEASVRETSFVENAEVPKRALTISPALTIEFFEDEPPAGAPADGSAVLIRGGLSFGSGFHPTTRMCLESLDRIFQQSPRPKRALDVGTGSGILALAARRLGAELAVGVEINPRAAREARENLRRNRAEREILIVQGSIDAVRGAFDLVIANLAPGPLLSLASALPGRLNTKGLLIVSGFFDAQRRELLSLLLGGSLLEQRREQDWNALVWQKD